MENEIYEFLRTVPAGKVVTYGQIAEHFGNKNLARHIGNVLHKNPDGGKYPCYKVVNAKGFLSEHFAFGGMEGQRKRLEQDGISVEGNRVDLTKYQWQMDVFQS